MSCRTCLQRILYSCLKFPMCLNCSMHQIFTSWDKLTCNNCFIFQTNGIQTEHVFVSGGSDCWSVTCARISEGQAFQTPAVYVLFTCEFIHFFESLSVCKSSVKDFNQREIASQNHLKKTQITRKHKSQNCLKKTTKVFCIFVLFETTSEGRFLIAEFWRNNIDDTKFERLIQHAPVYSVILKI